ncbi:MAG: PD-(D/E)XK nuclease family protein, partial [Clostridia bacterium]
KATNLRVYNTFLILLEEISDSLDDLKIDLKIFGQMLNITASYCDLGEIPNGIDQVIIGQADRIRADGRKCCFISGLNQGVFPPDNFKNGVLSSKEKEKLIEKGINLNHDDFYLSSMEDFYAYCAITAPKNILFLTYPLADRNFNKLFPSPYINQIKDIFPKIEMKNILAFDDLILAQNKKTLLSLYATNLNKANNKSNELKNCINGFKEIDNLFSEIDNAVVTKPFKIEEKEVIHKLFGDNLKISASKIERFKICRFAYFLEYAIKIKKIQKAEITPLESGSIIHFVLSEFISKKTKEEIIGIEKKDIKQEIKKITLQYCSNYIGNEENLSEKQKVIIKRIIDAICDIIIIISKEFEQSEFTPIDYEMKIDENTEIKPLILQSINGEKISVEGVIDRVDSFEKNGIKYIRIIDYKSGKKDFKLKEVFYGLNLQMLIYLITIWKNGKEKYGNIMPSGILYFPAKQNFAVVDKIDKEKALDNNLKNYKMSGLIIDDIEIINAMEKDIKGVFIPVKKGKDGLSKNSSVASLEELGKLRTYIEKQIINMADEIYAGEINAKVCKDNDKTPCDYCSYYKICLNENSENSIDIEDINKEEFFKLIDDK